MSGQSVMRNTKLAAFLGGVGSLLALYPSPEQSLRTARQGSPTGNYWVRVGNYVQGAMDAQEVEIKTELSSKRSSHRIVGIARK